MQFPKTGLRLVSAFLLFILSDATAATAQLRNPPLSKPENKEVLNQIDSRAKENVLQHLNRFAVEKLNTYDKLLDSLYKAEKEDTLAILERNYREGSSSQVSTIENLNKQIIDLTSEKDKFAESYSGLVRKALFAFGFWLVIIFLLLFFRKRRLKKSIEGLKDATLQLNALEASSIKGEKLFGHLSDYKDSIQKLNLEYSRLAIVTSEAAKSNDVAEGWVDISTKADALKNSVSSEEKIVHAILTQKDSFTDEMVSTDINSLCIQYLEIIKRGIPKSEEFNLQFTSDFEKKLPAIKVNHSAVGTLILNVLMNAVQAVREQNKKGVKGYQPKVSISTRILPKFLQIRVKDNGTGMKQEILEQATKEFFTTLPLSEGSGLGLFVANTIVSEMHKGEIKIESEEGNSTDVYIKFYL